MVTGTSADRAKFTESIKYFQKMREKSEKNVNYNLLVQHQFTDADKNNDGKLSLYEVAKLLKQLNIKISSKKVEKLFKEVQLDSCTDFMSQEEFTLFYNRINHRKEISFYFEKYAKIYDKKLLLSFHDLRAFLLENQHEDHPPVYCKNLVKLFSDLYPDYLTIYGFTSYLTSEFNEPCNQQLEEMMDLPLHEYYIATSHNTYLMEHQLHGRSSVDGYIRCLLQGCRCVELDCYDGFREPKITHGGTLTSKISFHSVVEAINDYAFVTSDLPVILSVENHCSSKGQDQMANIFKLVFKDKLYIPKNGETCFPSPLKLKKKIIIKNKKSDICYQAMCLIKNEAIVNSESSEEECRSSTSVCKCYGKQSLKHVSGALSSLVGLNSTKFEGFLSPNYVHTNICSIKEDVAIKLIAENPQKFAELCRSMFIKVYPKGARTLNSTNLNPPHFWASGTSVVAINYQYPGDSTQFNEAMFSASGKLGYVLKPTFLRNSDTKNSTPMEVRIVIKIISGVEIPNCETKQNDIVDPFVSIAISGSESSPAEVSTTTIDDNGFNPNWNEEFYFTIKSLETAFVKFSVMDSDMIGSPNFIGQRIFRLVYMKDGIRAVHLMDKVGRLVGRACILIELRKEFTVRNEEKETNTCL